jgi:hypothetical protein
VPDGAAWRHCIKRLRLSPVYVRQINEQAGSGDIDASSTSTESLVLATLSRRRHDLVLQAEQRDAMRAGRWAILTGTDLYGKTVGLVGFGAIARKVAPRLMGFDAHILVHTRTPEAAAGAPSGVEIVDLPTLLSGSDYVSLHVPATAATTGMMASRSRPPRSSVGRCMTSGSTTSSTWIIPWNSCA